MLFIQMNMLFNFAWLFHDCYGNICVHSMRGGAVAARRAHNPKVAGSSPAPATQ